MYGIINGIGATHPVIVIHFSSDFSLSKVRMMTVYTASQSSQLAVRGEQTVGAGHVQHAAPDSISQKNIRIKVAPDEKISLFLLFVF